jgi:hypothetical protein
MMRSTHQIMEWAAHTSDEHHPPRQIVCWMGTGTIHEEPLQWLKKVYSSLPSQMDGFAQAFAPEHVGGYTHLAWAAWQTHLHWKSNQLAVKKPEMEFSCRVAGTMQIPMAQARVGLQSKSRDVVLVLVFDKATFSAAQQKQFFKSISFAPKPIPMGSALKPTPSLSAEAWAMERSALCEC